MISSSRRLRAKTLSYGRMTVRAVSSQVSPAHRDQTHQMPSHRVVQSKPREEPGARVHGLDLLRADAERVSRAATALRTPGYGLREFSKYDSAGIAAHYSTKRLVVLCRIAELGIPFALWWLRSRWDKYCGGNESRSRKRAVELRELLCNAGPTCLKYVTTLVTVLHDHFMPEYK
jgi:hypothetical protein